jgi:hypothetical protein
VLDSGSNVFHERAAMPKSRSVSGFCMERRGTLEPDVYTSRARRGACTFMISMVYRASRRKVMREMANSLHMIEMKKILHLATG